VRRQSDGTGSRLYRHFIGSARRQLDQLNDSIIFVKINEVICRKVVSEGDLTAGGQPEAGLRIAGKKLNLLLEGVSCIIENTNSEVEEACLRLVECAIFCVFHKPPFLSRSQRDADRANNVTLSAII
jgi:hypothetical protein